MPRKRSLAEMEASEPPPRKPELTTIQKIRSMWEFSSVMQFIFMFGKAVKIDEDFDIEDFEEECLKPGYSEKLEEIGLTLLKWISSHRGLNYDIWDEYTRRQYQAKMPSNNPYGEEEEPKKFRKFDIFQKIRVLHQLTVWTFWNPDRIRERMANHPHEAQQLEWRVEEFGYGTENYGTEDELECQYYLLDDNRLYRRTEPPLPKEKKSPAKPKANSKKAQAARKRASRSKRRKTEEPEEAPEVEEEDTAEAEAAETNGEAQDPPTGADINTLGGYKWECVAITLTDYQNFIDSLKKRKDPNEKTLRKRLVDEVLPTIEAAEDKQRRKIERRERELLAMEKMTHAKRSSRIADKQERDKHEQEVAEAERRRVADLAAAHREEQKQNQMDQDRESRMMTREQRIKDREYKRLLAEEELVRAAEEEKKIAEGHARGSERQLKERIAKNKKELEDLDAGEEWTFDCSGCGVHGKNLDDGSHSVACDKCNVWQHSKCLGISKQAAEKDDFHLVCADCAKKANQPKISLKFKVTPSPAPPTPPRVAPSPQRPGFRVEVPLNRPPSQGHMNGSSYPSSTSPPHAQRPLQQYPPIQPNGYPPYGYSQNQNPYQFYPPTAQHQRTHTNSSSPPPMQQSPYAQFKVPRPAEGNPQNWAPIQYTPNQNAPRPSYPQPPYQQSYPYQQRPSSSHGIPRPTSSHAQTNGQPTPAARLPSPVINRPVMSPSQGNYDVGPVAGIPQQASYGSAQTPAHMNGTPTFQRPQHQTPSMQRPTSSSSASSATPHQQPAPSGMSPTKHTQSTSPLPPPSNVPMKMPTSPARATPAGRSVSGTPIFPPSEKLRPSPEQMNVMGGVLGGPVPTPSKLEVMGRAVVETETAEGHGGEEGHINGSGGGDGNGLGGVRGVSDEGQTPQQQT